jgi:DNA-directed RNA polymerase specialized sigma24 family protein
MISSKTETFKISKEMQAKIDALRDSGKTPVKTFTEEQDAIILKYYTIKNKQELAKVLGECVGTMRSRYKELSNGQA